jgi:hypothetical protein
MGLFGLKIHTPSGNPEVNRFEIAVSTRPEQTAELLTLGGNQ